MPDAGTLARLLSVVRPGAILSQVTARQLAVDLRQLAENCEEYAATAPPEQAIATPPAVLPPNPTAKRQKVFDYDRFAYRYVAFRLMYVGWKYRGLASQLDEPETVEAHLFGALEKTCLIRPGMPPKDMSYTRCGRTDIGVSALANMITLEVRSKAAAGQPLPPADQELDYPFLLNKVLPPDIQITGWAPADPSFHARFSATNRRYKYFFAGASGLDREAMQAACDHLVGEHDFQHFCKINLANTQMHVRRVVHANVQPTPAASSGAAADLLVLDIKGSAFLWHQVRCIAAILLMVGRGHEKPGIVHDMLDIERQPRKPQYGLASEAPLILLGAEFDGLPQLRLSPLAASMLAKRVDALMRDHTARLAVLAEVAQEVETLAAAAGGGVPPRKHRPLLGRATDEPLAARLEAFLAKQAAKGAAGAVDGASPPPAGGSIGGGGGGGDGEDVGGTS